MIKKIRLLLLVLPVILNTGFFHEYYVSITEIDYNKKDKTIEIALKFITHDFEKALMDGGKPDLLLGHKRELNNANSLIMKYINNKLKLKVNGVNKELSFIGKEVTNDESLWVYAEINNIEEVKSIELENNLLTESFAEQENIVHIAVNGSKKSCSLRKTATKCSIELK